MIKHSAASLAGTGDRKTALIDMERARIAWEALARHALDHDVLSELDMTIVGEAVYNNAHVPMSSALFVDDEQ